MKYVSNNGTLRPKSSQIPRVVKFNRAALAAMDVTGYRVKTEFQTMCGSVSGDGGQGTYLYDPSSSLTPVPGLIIAPAAGPGRFLLYYDTFIDPVRDMGADPTAHVDSSAVIQAALDFAANPTYGWFTVMGQANQTTLGVRLIGAFKLTSTLYLRAGDLFGPKKGAIWADYGANTILHIMHGGHGIVVDMAGDAPKFRTFTIRDLVFTGNSETYQQNKKEIKDVVSRFIFDVNDADAPPPLDDSNLWASHNTCFFFDPDGSYLGSARVASTAASPTPGRTRVTLASTDGTDVFSSINNTAGDALTTACTVVWPVHITDESSATYGITDFNDPAAAGSCAIFVKSTTATYGGVVGNVRLNDLYIDRFHCGIRVGPKVVGHDAYHNISITRSRFAALSIPRPLNTTDAFFTGQQWYSSQYRPDYNFPRTQGPEVTFTPGTPGTVNLTAHGYRIGSAIQFKSASTTLMTNLRMGVDYYISPNGHTTNSFQLTSTYLGADVDLSGSNSHSVYIAGSVVDVPGMRNGPYAIHGIPSVSRWGSVLVEFASYAGIYMYRAISVNLDHVYCDSCMRGIMFGKGYTSYSSPSTAAYNGWMSIDRLEIKCPLGGTIWDTFHTNQAAIEFENLGAGSNFSGVSIGQLFIIGDFVGPDYPYAFNLQSASYNNRVIIGIFVDKNGTAALYAPGSKPVEFTSHIGVTSASDVQRGWYDNGTKRAFCVASADVFSLDGNGALFGNSTFTGSPITSLSSNGVALTLQRTGGSPQNFSVRLSASSWRWHDDDLDLDSLSMFSDASANQLWIGSFLGNPGSARSSNLYSEGRVGGTDLTPSHLNIVGPQGTGSADGNGEVRFWTATPGVSGTAQQSFSLKMSLKRTGQLNFTNVATPLYLTEGDIWFSTTKGFRQYFGASEKPLGFVKCGIATLTAGSVVVSAGSIVTASCVILLTSQIDGGTPGGLRVSATSLGVSFTVTSTSATDTSTFGWALIEL